MEDEPLGSTDPVAILRELVVAWIRQGVSDDQIVEVTLGEVRALILALSRDAP